MATKRRFFSDKRKREIVALVPELGAKGVMEKFKIGESTLTRWRKRYGAWHQPRLNATPASPRMKAELIDQLKAENERLRQLLLDIMLGKRPELVSVIAK